MNGGIDWQLRRGIIAFEFEMAISIASFVLYQRLALLDNDGRVSRKGKVLIEAGSLHSEDATQTSI